MATLYTDIAGVQRDGYNFPGGSGGLTASPTGGGFNDPVKELGSVSSVTAIYTMTGAEVQNDIIYLCRLTMGAVVHPTGSVAYNGIGTTAAITVGDTDTQGGTVAQDASRYSGAITVTGTATAPLAFASGTALLAPAEITDDPTWVTASFSTLTVPVAGKVLVFRLALSDNR